MEKSWIKFIAVLLLAFYCGNYLMNAGDWHFIDNVNLIIHEAGHWVFYPFGNLLQAMGGSLLQVLVPLMFAVYFLVTRQNFSAAVMFMWLAINFFNVAVYVNDAMAMKLELLGGENSVHDWNFILLELGSLRKAPTIANIINFIGILSIAAGLYTAWRGKVLDEKINEI